MHVSEIRYSETLNTGDYCSRRLEVAVSLSEGDEAVEALRRARLFVSQHIKKENPK